MKAFGFVSSTTDFAMWYIRDPSIFYLVGRVTTGLIGTIAVYLLYRIGTRIHSSRVGLIAAALMASNVLQVVHSHYITVDIPLTCLCLAGLLFIVRIDQSGSRADYIGACLFAALATITKLPGVLLIIPLFAVHMKRSLQSDGQFLQTFFNKSVVIGGAVFITVFFMSNPGALLHFGDYVSNVTGMVGGGEGGDSEAAADSNFVGFYARAMYQWIGLPIIVASLIGLLVSLRNKIHVCSNYSFVCIELFRGHLAVFESVPGVYEIYPAHHSRGVVICSIRDRSNSSAIGSKHWQYQFDGSNSYAAACIGNDCRLSAGGSGVRRKGYKNCRKGMV